MQSTIVFRRRRDLGEVLNTTFAFLRAHFVPLAKAQLFIVAPAWLGLAVVSVLFQFSLADFDPMDPDSLDLGGLGMAYAGFLFFGVVSTVLEVLVIYGYVLRYQETEAAVGVDDVWRFVRARFWRVAGAILVFGVVAVLGAVVAVIPCLGALAYMAGIVYAGVVFAVGLVVLLREDRGIAESMHRARGLVRGAFWPTLGVLFVAWLLTLILSLIFSMPAAVMGFVAGMHGASDVGPVGNTLVVVLTLLSSMASLLLYPIPLIATALQYFSLVEDKERVGLMERIDALQGSADAAPGAPEPPAGSPDDTPGSLPEGRAEGDA